MIRTTTVKTFLLSNPEKPPYTCGKSFQKTKQKKNKGKIECTVTQKSTYSLWVDPVEGPLSFSHDTRHCLDGIEKSLSAKQEGNYGTVSTDYRGSLLSLPKINPLKFG